MTLPIAAITAALTCAACAGDVCRVRLVRPERDGSTVTEWGSGTAVGQRLLVTCNHVVSGPGRVEVEIAGAWRAATVERTDADVDLALLKVQADVEPFAFLALPKLTVSASAESAPVAESAAAIRELTITGAFHNGQSGGAVALETGELVAIIRAIEPGPRATYATCIPASAVKAFLDKP